MEAATGHVYNLAKRGGKLAAQACVSWQTCPAFFKKKERLKVG